MENSETLSPPSFVGRVRNGVIVVDATTKLAEGMAVRIVPIAANPSEGPRDQQLEQMKKLFAQWDEEDGKLSDEEADWLHDALQQNRGLSFRTPNLD